MPLIMNGASMGPEPMDDTVVSISAIIDTAANYTFMRKRPPTKSKCASLETSRVPVSRAVAAIQMSFSGIGVPFFARAAFAYPYRSAIPRVIG